MCSHTGETRDFMIYAAKPSKSFKSWLVCLEDEDLQDHVGNYIPGLIYFDWSDRVSA